MKKSVILKLSGIRGGLMIKRALIHRYDNKPDILAVKKNGCSEVYQRSRDESYEIVVVVPTRQANTTVAVWGEAISNQYTPENPRTWPGRPDDYPVRVDLNNVKYTTMEKVRTAVTEAGQTWRAAWVVTTVNIDTDQL